MCGNFDIGNEPIKSLKTALDVDLFWPNHEKFDLFYIDSNMERIRRPDMLRDNPYMDVSTVV